MNFKSLICKALGHKKKLVKVYSENLKTLSNHKGKHKHRYYTWGKYVEYDVVCERCGEVIGHKSKYVWKK